ncbi:GB1/RHD3-type guanine nucleotide-binding (G) [Gracilaria domingensis]|nr:GB1/RHD3-type guanine nucleotide-binding (G) [Gracilaria domingensis]
MDIASSNSVLQLVNARGEFNSEEFEKFATEHFPEDQTDQDANLVTVALLGSRSSGKSTLANRLFQTDFAVARPFAGRGTQGCVAAVSSSRYLILDSQGSDGRDGENHKVARVATLSLALADALIFNLWAADLGRYEAAGYSMLRTIFTEHIRIFQGEPVKTLIVFVIRDHDDDSPLDSLKSILINDIESMWKDIDANGASLSDLFDFEFVSLPHIRHRKDEFDEAVADLSQRFCNPNHSGYLLNTDYSRKIPIEGLYNYADIVWKDTEQDKSVELPGKKDLVAAYRCDVAYDAQQRPSLAQLNRWTSEVDRGNTVPDFGVKASNLLDSALEKYDRDTLAHASSPIRAKKRSELQSSLQSRVRSLFNKQILLLQNAALQRFKKILLSKVANPMYETETPIALRNVDEWFARHAEFLLVPSMRLSFRSARQEVQNALHTYGEGFANSPTAQLQAMQQMERQAQRAPPRQRNIEFGLGINAACRPSGFGNFQLITGYNHGPHSMQFTLVNDKDAAEQEGQGQVPFFRIQPTINTTVDL